jgi:AcrR family transcriptional regulator
MCIMELASFGRTSVPRTKNARTRNAILGAAARAFEERDFHDVLTDDIASTAGIGKATLYRYFSTKEDLYFATLLRGFDELEAAIAAAGAAGSASERLRHVAAEVLRVFWNRPSFYTLMHHNEIRFRAQDRLLQRRRSRVLLAVRGILEDGVARRELRPLDAPIAAELFMGLVRAALFRRRPSDKPAYLVETLLGVFLRGAAA